MSLFNRSGYIRALLVLLPFGIGFLYFGIDGLATKEISLPKHTGVVKKTYIGQAYDEVIDGYTKTYQLKLKNNKKTFKTTITKHIDTLKTSLHKGDSIIVWTGKNNNDIKKVVLNGRLIIKYNRTIGIYLLILIIGITYTILSIVYLIKYPEDLWGGIKKKCRNGLINIYMGCQ